MQTQSDFRPDLIKIRELRRHGQAPVLPVFVGRGCGFLEENVREVGAAFIYAGHNAVDYDFSPLCGLDVIVDMPVDALSLTIIQKIKAARPRRLRAWVDGGLMSYFPVPEETRKCSTQQTKQSKRG